MTVARYLLASPRKSEKEGTCKILKEIRLKINQSMGDFVEVKPRTKTRITYHKPDTVCTGQVYIHCAATYTNFGFSKPLIIS